MTAWSSRTRVSAPAGAWSSRSRTRVASTLELRWAKLRRELNEPRIESVPVKWPPIGWLTGWARPVAVYFIQACRGGPVKIGSSAHPSLRLETLQTGNPDELRIVGVVPGGAALEKRLHKKLAASHVRGEWFEASAALAALAELRAGRTS